MPRSVAHSVALLGLALLCVAAAPLATVPISRMNLPWWRERHEEKLRDARAHRVDVVFLGDSITQEWEQPDGQPVWQRFYADRHALDLGFTGDATSHLLWRIEHGEIDGLHPKVAVVLIGANNLGRLHWPASDDVAGINAVIDAVRERLPAARIILLSVLPSDRGPWVRESTDAINAALAARYGGGRVSGVVWLDVASIFLTPKGAIDTSLFRDPRLSPPRPALHPSTEGLRRMADAMEPAMTAILQDRDHRS